MDYSNEKPAWKSLNSEKHRRAARETVWSAPALFLVVVVIDVAVVVVVVVD